MLAEGAERRSAYRLRALAQTLQPLLVLAVGAMIGLIALAYLPPPDHPDPGPRRMIARPPRRRGFTLLEVLAAGALLAVAMTLAVQALGWLAADRRALDRRREAAQEAANIMERLASTPWDDLTPEALDVAKLSPEARKALPGGILKVAVTTQGALKRLAVEVRWRGQGGPAEAPVRLTSWVARRKESPR